MSEKTTPQKKVSDEGPGYVGLERVALKDYYPQLTLKGDTLTIELPDAVVERNIAFNLDIEKMPDELVISSFNLSIQKTTSIDLSPLRNNASEESLKIGDQIKIKVWNTAVVIGGGTIGMQSGARMQATREAYGLADESDPELASDWPGTSESTKPKKNREDQLVYTLTMTPSGWEASDVENILNQDAKDELAISIEDS